MKTKFNTVDIIVSVKELSRLCSMRVVNVYDIDNKTYLIKLNRQGQDEKGMLLLESGSRIHYTNYDWPKNAAPSGFSMKLRKHIKGRRLESINQLGADRIIDLQFGSNEAAYHVILELYDRGNIVLTDYQYTILNILRPRTDTCQDVKFVVRETYPIANAKQHVIPSEELVETILKAAKTGETLKKTLMPHLDYGPALLDHSLLIGGFSENVKIGKGFDAEDSADVRKLMAALEEAEMTYQLLITETKEGIIVQKKEKRVTVKEGESPDLLTYDEFHPMLYKQFENKPITQFSTFNLAVDEYFSKVESQKLDMKALQQEKSALKKLDNIKKDHEKRLDALKKEQDIDNVKGQLIQLNQDLVEKAILVIQSAIANQIDWGEIGNLLKEAQAQGDPVARAIKSLNLKSNHITLFLSDPYQGHDSDEYSDEDTEKKPTLQSLPSQKVDIDLQLTAYANSRRYFDKKKTAAKKEQKTLDASAKALKSAEKKTKETLKDVAMTASINKSRKVHWFEKFLWFITSENYLVIGGRDQQQNEMIVKKYLRPGDLYVHADLHGASSCVIKNPKGTPVPPKSLNEAGTMAICNSAAWDAKVVTSAWWVYHDQVSKTAPTGEYLTTGSFMIRGKKNYLPPSYLVYGFGMLFKLEESCIERHLHDRKVRTTEEDEEDLKRVAMAIEIEGDDVIEEKEEEALMDESDENGNEDGNSQQNSVEIPLGELNIAENKVESSGSVNFNSDDDSDLNDSDNDGTRAREKNETKRAITEDAKEEAEKEEDTYSYPDTKILLYNSGEYRTQSSREENQEGNKAEMPTGKSRLSAKQRREMKKLKKQGMQQEGVEEKTAESVEDSQALKDGVKPPDYTTQFSEESQMSSICEENEKQSQSQKPKRGQKSKLKKIKEKYKDQDEEERQIKMEILQSDGLKKEEKKKKGKQTKESQRPPSAKQQLQKQKQKGQNTVQHLHTQNGQDHIVQPSVNMSVKVEDKLKQQAEEPNEPDDQTQDDKEETSKTDDTQDLLSLTGIPLPEDELLYAIPVAAPYSSLLNYKYKVKLMPGSTKRGKAAKLAINAFMHEKTLTSREKDLMRILKDVDTSRNIPGKVKVSAPNLHKAKGK